jgi:hypothetical protein
MTLPEINFAARLVRIKKLVPPINIFGLAQEYAVVQRVTFPVQVDGVCLDLKQFGKQPRILVNRTLHKHRLRFTLAHELGHVIIPWHVGSIVDETEESRIDLGLVYWQLEGEANRFASELLMPSTWAGGILAEAKNPFAGAESISAIAEVSFEAAMIKAQNLLPKGYLFARFDNNDLMSTGRTVGTLASMPKVGRTRAAELFPEAANHWVKSKGSQEYHVWRFADEMPIVESARPWREVFQEIADDVGIPPTELGKFKLRVMAVVSNANNSTRTSRTPEAVNSAAIQRLRANVDKIPYLDKFIRHSSFNELLAAKIPEFFSKKRSEP